MKVPDNKLSSIKAYFTAELVSMYEASEVKVFFEMLAFAFLKFSKTDLILNANETLTESELLLFFYAIKKLQNNTPIQHIAGSAWFYGNEFIVSEHVLIPRPETEELVDWILQAEFTTQRLLDVGTGTGCISISIKKEMPSVDVVAMDVSPEALAIAEKNAQENNVKVEWRLFDILKWESFHKEEKFDVIVSNPPYIPNSDKQNMAANVLDYEPDLALFVPDNDPLLFYKVIADFALKYLATNGKLYFEIHERFGTETKNMLKEKGFKSIELRKDMQGKNRMVRASVV